MRIFYITGLGEDEFIFDPITALPGEKIFLSLWKELPQQAAPGLNASAFARQLTERYSMTKADLVIGHSTGGWVALHIKQLTGGPVVQLSSWTDTRKVNVPLRFRPLIYFAARTGLYLNRFVLRLRLKNDYAGSPSAALFRRVFERLMTGNRANAVNQLRIVFNPPARAATVSPDLRIHARGDKVVRPPDEPFCEVPGDHFALYTHPDEVLAPIRQLLQQNLQS